MSLKQKPEGSQFTVNTELDKEVKKGESWRKGYQAGYDQAKKEYETLINTIIDTKNIEINQAKVEAVKDFVRWMDDYFHERDKDDK